jgi:hypothetical protein
MVTLALPFLVCERSLFHVEQCRTAGGKILPAALVEQDESPRKVSGLLSAATPLNPPEAPSKPLTPADASTAILSFHTSGASWWTFLPSESTATVTGMSSTVNS